MFKDMNEKIFLTIIILNICLLNACVENKQYHKVDDNYVNKRPNNGVGFGVGNDGWDSDIMGAVPGLTSQEFNYAFLEYDSEVDPVKPFDPIQIKKIKQYIDKNKKSDEPFFVQIFVHGWHHNAEEKLPGHEGFSIEDRNLLYFKNMLAKTKYELSVRRNMDKNFPKYQVLGIYVGWHGESIKSEDIFPLISTISIGSRAAAADRVGRSDAFANDLKEISGSLELEKNNNSNRLVLMGHSFGGRIVSRFMLRNFDNKDNKTNWQPLGARSLVATINPAISTYAFKNVMERKQEGDLDKPTWLNITSESDYATGLLFPLADSIGRLLIIGWGLTDNPVPWWTRTIGHDKDYQTHRLHIDYADIAKCDVKKCKNNEPDCKPKTGLNGESCELIRPPFIKDFSDQRVFNLRSTQWYDLNSSGEKRQPIWFGRGGTHCDAQLYVSNLTYGKNKGFHSAPGRMWNIVTDDSVIDDEDGTTPVAAHNAFVQTTLNRMIIDLALAL